MANGRDVMGISQPGEGMFVFDIGRIDAEVFRFVHVFPTKCTVDDCVKGPTWLPVVDISTLI